MLNIMMSGKSSNDMTLSITHTNDISTYKVENLLIGKWLNPYKEWLKLSNYQSGVLSYYNDILVGFISYVTLKSVIYVGVGFVKEEYRRQGVYSKMWLELVRIAKEMKYVHIEGHCSQTNIEMVAFNDKYNRIVDQGKYVYSI